MNFALIPKMLLKWFKGLFAKPEPERITIPRLQMTEVTRAEFRKRFVALVDESDMPMAVIAKELAVAPSTVKKWYLGKSAPRTHAERLKVLNMMIEGNNS